MQNFPKQRKEQRRRAIVRLWRLILRSHWRIYWLSRKPGADDELSHEIRTLRSLRYSLHLHRLDLRFSRLDKSWRA